MKKSTALGDQRVTPNPEKIDWLSICPECIALSRKEVWTAIQERDG
jgi:hypothetical protein